jgi:hypothetical protein
MRGEERFSAPEKAQLQSCALALDRETEAEAYLNNGNFSAGLKSSSPLLKQGASTKDPDDFSAALAAK